MGRIYILYAEADPETVYVGSTTLALKTRMSGHKCMAKKKGFRVYQHLRQFDKDTWRIELVEEWDGHLKKREEFWRLTLGATLNEIRAYVSPEEKAEAQLETMRNWRAKNRDWFNAQGRSYYAKDPEKAHKATRKYQKKKKVLKAIEPLLRAAAARFSFNVRPRRDLN